MIDWQPSGPGTGGGHTDIRSKTAEGIARITFAGDATMLCYLSEEAQEGRDSCVHKRAPDLAGFPRRP